ncbi:WXG100 family type VII secretion target [Salana multivorans]
MSASYDRSTFYGIDTQSTREGASQMQGNADDLGAMVQDIGALLADVLWIGPAAQRFKGEWEGSMRPQMQQAAESLQANAAEMRRRADAQDAASA